MKTYEEMARSALKRIEEYEKKQKDRRKKLVRISTSVISVSLVALLCVFVRQRLDVGRVQVQTGTDGEISKPESETVQTVRTDEQSQNLQAEETNDVTDEIYDTANRVNSVNSPVNVPDQPFSPFSKEPREYNYTKMISSYPVESKTDTAPPERNTFRLSEELKGALAEYGDSAIYRVYVEIFAGSDVVADSDVFMNEANRLYEAGGYTCAIESDYLYEELQTVRLTLHATAEQVRNFVCDSKYGYILYLFDEKV